MKKVFKILIIFLVLVVVFFLVLLWQKTVVLAPTIGSLSGKGTTMIITSSAFASGQAIPPMYGCYGQNINPPLAFKEVPASAKSLALIVDDPDSPSGDWAHWLVWNIDPQTADIKTNSVPLGAVQGLTNFGANHYGGPCPNVGTHHYQFKVYALDTMLDLPKAANKTVFLKAIANHILSQGLLVGTYSHQ